MADYPSFPQIVGSKEILADGTVVDVAESGKPRFRSYYTQIRRNFIVMHDVDTTDKDTLLTFHVNNQFTTFTFDWEGDNHSVEYTVRFNGPPQPVPYQADGRFRVTIQLVAV